MVKVIASYWLILFIVTGCTKNDSYYWSDYTEGYVVGSFKCKLEQHRNRSTPVGYCILLVNNTDSSRMMNFYTFDKLNKVIDYHKGPPNYDEYTGGPVFIAGRKYKIGFRYRYVSENEKKRFNCGPVFAFGPQFPWEDYREIKLKDIKKIEKQIPKP